jgi:excisionase family DNA binding protein
MPRSLMIDQAADLLGVSRRTVYYRIREGRLQTVRTACGSQRVLVDSIQAFLAVRGAFRDRAAGVSDTGLSERYPAP